jgi:hypothetical protein
VQRKQGIDEISRFGRGVKSFAGPVFILFGRALLAALMLTVIIAVPVQAGDAGWDELNKKAADLRSGKKYSEAIKTYEQLLQLTRKTYGENNVKIAEILIEMSLIQRYDLDNENKYNELQDKAKKVKMTLNNTLSCQEPVKWSYEPCRERWLGPDPCFRFTDYRNYIKVTYYGLEGSEFKTPQDLIKSLMGLFGKFEAMDTITIMGRDAVRIKLRYEDRGRWDRDGRYLMKEYRYEEFILLPMKQGFLAFNFNMNRRLPVPRTFSKEGAPKDLYGDAYESYQTWSSFLDGCSVTK